MIQVLLPPDIRHKVETNDNFVKKKKKMFRVFSGNSQQKENLLTHYHTLHVCVHVRGALSFAVCFQYISPVIFAPGVLCHGDPVILSMVSQQCARDCANTHISALLLHSLYLARMILHFALSNCIMVESVKKTKQREMRKELLGFMVKSPR